MIRDELDELRRASSELPADDPGTAALKTFLEGRYTIETTWDYQKTYRAYRQAIDMLDGLGASGEVGTVGKWLRAVIEGHLQLQEAEADWTLCNFQRSGAEYKNASDAFSQGSRLLSEKAAVQAGKDLEEYTQGWMNIALGMHRNLTGYLLLTEDRAEDSALEFEKGKEALTKAEQHFARISNSLGQHDARSYMVDAEKWREETMLFSEFTEVRWKDYAFFSSRAVFEKVLASLRSVQTTYPSELLTRKGPESLRLFVSEVGRATTSKLGGFDSMDLEVRLVFHPEYMVEVQYSIRLPRRIDAFTLYLLKILNTDATPTYGILFDGAANGISFELGDARLRDMTREILVRLAERFGGPRDVIVLDSFVALYLYDTSPELQSSDLANRSFSYLSGLFSESETLTLDPGLNKTTPPTNAFEGIQNSAAAAFISQRSAVLLLPRMQEWEVKLYSDALDYSLQGREAVARLTAEMKEEGDKLGAKLQILRDAVSRSVVMTQTEVRDLISSNLDVRLRTLRLFDVRQRRDALHQSGIRDVRVFLERAEESLGTLDLLHAADTLSERIEALYNTAFNLGQDYLSLTIAVNSDVSRRAFNLLNVIMMGSLGLSFATAVIRTPIGYTIGLLAVFGMSFFGYLYLGFVKRRVIRLWG